MLKTAVFSTLLVGCFKFQITPRPSAPNMYDLSGFAGPRYEESNSICVDGLLTNLGNSCDTLVEIIGEGAIRVVQCHKAKNKNNIWDNYTFIVYNTHDLPPPPLSNPVCVDPTSIIYIKERP